MQNPESILYSWLHISDLHVGHGDASYGWDQKLVLQALPADVEDALKLTGRNSLDAVFVTGDIAFSGGVRSSAEYVDAAAFLTTLAGRIGLGKDAVFVVPGNHDVQRSADQDRNVRRLLRDLRSGEESLDGALSHPDDRALLARRQANYLAFAEKFAPATSSAGEPQLFWSHRQTVRGLRLRLLGLNTALLAADEADHGRLRLGLAALGESLLRPPLEPDELIITLSHHPLRNGWLADESECVAWLRSQAHIHVFGHIHEGDAEEARTGAGGHFVRISAGAAHGEKQPAGVPSGHGYNLAAVSEQPDGGLALQVWPRRFSDKNKQYRADVDSLPDGQAFATLHLRLKRSRTAGPSSSTVRPKEKILAPPLPAVGSAETGGETSGAEARVPTADSLRHMLIEILISDSDLDAFCVDFFREVYGLFSAGMNRTQKHTLLLTHAAPREILRRLRQRYGPLMRQHESLLEYES